MRSDKFSQFVENRLDTKVKNYFRIIFYLHLFILTIIITFGAISVNANPVAPDTSREDVIHEIIFFMIIFVINFVIDLIVFLIGNELFTKVPLAFKILIQTIIVIASLGMLIDIVLIVIFSGPEMASYVLGFVFAFIIFGSVDYFIINYVAKIPRGTMLTLLSGFMGIITNPYIFIIITRFHY